MNFFLKFFILSTLLMLGFRTIYKSIISTNYRPFYSHHLHTIHSQFQSQSQFHLSFSTMSNNFSNKITILSDNSNIDKPVTDDRLYRLFKINSNDLHVLVINDPTADKSAASLDVNVGAFTDKQYNVPGLAHFCEHLLFMGTEKYPKENEYSNYLSKHSGHSNAYTAAEHTNYYFQVGSDYLEGALDRFAQFFISPLFSVSCKDREINAVDSENKKNLQSDNWRLYQLDKSNSNPNHPYNGFSTGNFQTLHIEPTNNGLNVRDILIDFHKSHYSSNLMSLVILGKEDLDTLTNWSIEKFQDISNKQLSRPTHKELILTKDYLHKLIKAKPIMDKNELEITFMIPDDLESQWESKPSSYYSHLLGHESEGSVLYYLKHKQWVTELSAGNVKVCQGNSFFVLNFELTPLGLENWETVVLTVFQYLKAIVNDEPKKWIWEEISNMSVVNFKFRQKAEASSTVSKMSGTLYKYIDTIPPNYLLSSTILRKFDNEAIKKYGSYLNPNNFRISLVSQSLQGLDKTEKWYGTEYAYEDIPQDLLSSIKSASFNQSLHYPKPNDFIPTNFDVSVKSLTPLLHPYVIEDNNKSHIWFKQDDQFEVPKGTIEIIFHLPNSNTNVKSSTLSSLLGDLLEDDLNQLTYYASLVGLKVHISGWRDGFNIKVSGYNDKLPVLLEQVLNKFFNFKPNKERFETIKYKLGKQFKNFGYNQPYGQIGTHLLLLVNEKTYQYADRLEALNSITFEELEEFYSKTIWETGIFSESLIHGNFNIDKAYVIKELINGYIKDIKPIAETFEEVEKQIKFRNYVLSPNDTIRYEIPLEDPKNINSCIEYYFQMESVVTPENVRTRVLSDLLGTTLKETCFNQLRTKEQLGYVVFSGVVLGRTQLGFRILVQSERTSDYLQYRIEEFLDRFGRIVEKFDESEFSKYKQALKDTKLTKLKHLGEETSRFWNYIVDGKYDFEARFNHVKILETISLEEFKQFYKQNILNNKSRLILHLKSQCPTETSHLKLVQSSLINFLYRNDLEFSSDKLETIIQANLDDYDGLIHQIIQEIQTCNKDNSNIPSFDTLLQVVKHDVANPVPDKYHGPALSNVDEFRSRLSLGGYPVAFNKLSTFYYPHDQSHL
ncbi:Metalloenzyme, LuxS/M16 peptidase-like protein [Scheffersomyces amazonensis]|uniref:Metalloenzyme, LuxS/M16 peptidase-like protein n=1 Tax=Scheffersomyces amazonensis TaxID=1078765 RepID=UPI00315D8DD9